MADDTFFDSNDFTSFDIQVSKDPDVTLHGHRTKSTDKPPLALLHGFPQTHVIWHKVAPTLAKHFTLVIPDLRGYGRSSKPAAPWKTNPSDHSLYAKKSMGADISALMRSLGHEKYYVCGHDRGGRVTHSLCVNYPNEVRRAMLMDICPTLAMYEACDMVVASAYWHWLFLIQPAPFPEDAVTATPEAYATKMLRGLPGKSGEDIFGPQAYAEYLGILSDRDGVHAMCEDYRAGRWEDCDEQRKGGKIQCPLRLLWGAHGLVGKKFDAMEEWTKVSEPSCVDKKSEALDSGHYIPEEDPEGTIRHCLEFFKE